MDDFCAPPFISSILCFSRGLTIQVREMECATAFAIVSSSTIVEIAALNLLEPSKNCARTILPRILVGNVDDRAAHVYQDLISNLKRRIQTISEAIAILSPNTFHPCPRGLIAFSFQTLHSRHSTHWFGRSWEAHVGTSVYPSASNAEGGN